MIQLHDPITKDVSGYTMSSSVEIVRGSDGEGKALDTPIDKIPDELLALIFVHFDDHTETKKSSPALGNVGSGFYTAKTLLLDHIPTPHILSGVDRRWRRVAIDLTSLWNHIVLSFPKFAFSPSTYVERPSLWIERSRTSPLGISIDLSEISYALDGAEKPLLNLVLPYIDRWRTFNVIADRAEDLAHLVTALDTAAAPLLREVVMFTRDKMTGVMAQSQDDIYHGHKSFLLGGLPSLQSVRLIGMCHLSTIPLHNLTSLDLRNPTSLRCRPTYEDVCDLIASSPTLNHLTLHSLSFALADDADLAPLAIPSLKSLSINFRPIDPRTTSCSLVLFLSLLSAPCLEEMELICIGYAKIQQLPDLISKRSPRPEYTNLHTFKLAISHSVDDGAIERLFHCFCSSTTTFLSIRNTGFILIPEKTEVFIVDPDCKDLRLEHLKDSPLRVVQVPRHAAEQAERWSSFSSTIKVEIVDNPALFKYTGEDDSDLIVASDEEEDDDNEAWEEDDDVDFDEYEIDEGFAGYGSEDDDEYEWD